MGKRIEIRCTDEEYAQWKEWAERDGRSLSAWVRWKIGSPPLVFGPPYPLITCDEEDALSIGPRPAGRTETQVKEMVDAGERACKEEVERAVQKPAPKFPEGHSVKCTCLKCQKAKGWRG